MKRIIVVGVYIIICLLTGFIASKFQVEALTNWYPTLNKPSLTPPNIAFPIAWTTLYILMGISGGLITFSKNINKSLVQKIFFVQLVLNFSWSIGFFYLQNPLLGLINIIILDVMVLFYILKSYSVNKISATLFIPYLLWILFATYLNFYIVVNN